MIKTRLKNILGAAAFSSIGVLGTALTIFEACLAKEYLMKIAHSQVNLLDQKDLLMRAGVTATSAIITFCVSIHAFKDTGEYVQSIQRGY